MKYLSFRYRVVPLAYATIINGLTRLYSGIPGFSTVRSRIIVIDDAVQVILHIHNSFNIGISSNVVDYHWAQAGFS